jgi:hypothetical protein
MRSHAGPNMVSRCCLKEGSCPACLRAKDASYTRKQAPHVH